MTFTRKKRVLFKIEIIFSMHCIKLNTVIFISLSLSFCPRAPAAAGRGGGEAAMTSEGGEVVEDLDLQNLQELANNADADEQDIPMNAGGLGMMGGGGGAAQLRRHRDLVDYLYMLTMMGFLALIAYVTGSFGRLMVFAGGIIFMML